MPERRYNDDEVEAIFARASEVEPETPRQLQSVEGRTLTELQAIGQEAGLSPEAIAMAAHSLDQPAQPQAARFLGLPLGVARTVKLNRRLTDAEWERLVVQLRETFEARGSLRDEGPFRSWSNGNLQVLLEPDGEGQRIRFRTMHGQSRALMFMGLGLVGISLLGAVAGMLAVGGSGGGFDLIGAGSELRSVALIGAAAFGFGALRLPGWARRRREQMEALARNVAQLPPDPNRA